MAAMSSFTDNLFAFGEQLLNIGTRVKTHNLFRVDENSIEQCCAAHIVQRCQQYCHRLRMHRCATRYTSPMISLSHGLRHIHTRAFLASTFVRISV